MSYNYKKESSSRSNRGGGSSYGNRNVPKQKISLVLRDPNEIPHRKGVNSLAIVNEHSGHKKGSVNFFSASRDRLIKLWSVNYQGEKPQKISSEGKDQVNLVANLDGHTDWVN